MGQLDQFIETQQERCEYNVILKAVIIRDLNNRNTQ